MDRMRNNMQKQLKDTRQKVEHRATDRKKASGQQFGYHKMLKDDPQKNVNGLERRKTGGFGDEVKSNHYQNVRTKLMEQLNQQSELSRIQADRIEQLKNSIKEELRKKDLVQ